MSVKPSPAIVGIFKDRPASEQAIDALYNVGIDRENIRYSVPGTSGGFFEDIKSLFTGTSASSENLANDLTIMGLSDEEAQYYASEYHDGNIILAVLAPGHEQDVSNILRHFGAYGVYDADEETTDDVQQPSAYDSTQQNTSMTTDQPDDTQEWYSATQPHARITREQIEQEQAAQEDRPAASSYDPLPYSSQHSVDTSENVAEENQATSSNVEEENQVSHSEVAEPSYQESQANEVTPESTSEYQAHQVNMEDSENVAETNQAFPTNGAVPESVAAEQATSSNTETPAYTAEEQIPQDTAVAPENITDEHAAPAGEVAAENVTSGYQAQTTPEGVTEPASAQAEQVVPAATVAPQYSEKLQMFQQQLQATQQQLQESKAQLQAVKEHEAQLQAVKKQLEEVQAELQATQAELQDTHSRIEQY